MKTSPTFYSGSFHRNQMNWSPGQDIWPKQVVGTSRYMPGTLRYLQMPARYPKVPPGTPLWDLHGNKNDPDSISGRLFGQNSQPDWAKKFFLPLLFSSMLEAEKTSIYIATGPYRKLLWILKSAQTNEQRHFNSISELWLLNCRLSLQREAKSLYCYWKWIIQNNFILPKYQRKLQHKHGERE